MSAQYPDGCCHSRWLWSYNLSKWLLVPRKALVIRDEKGTMFDSNRAMKALLSGADTLVQTRAQSSEIIYLSISPRIRLSSSVYSGVLINSFHSSSLTSSLGHPHPENPGDLLFFSNLRKFKIHQVLTPQLSTSLPSCLFRPSVL